jgi:AcrR family transcriptional regulator
VLLFGAMASAARSARNAALALAKERPEMGKVRAARELRGRGIQLSASAVHTIWTQHGLATSYDRLRRRAGRRAALSDSQQARLRRATISRRVTARAGSNGSTSHPRREELLATAAKIFSARGYEGASLREICAAAGILPGSMYHHFSSKEDLFVSVHAEGFRHLNEVVDRALEGVAGPWERIEAAIAAHLAELVERTDVVAVTSASLFHMEGSHLQRRLNREREAYENRFRKLIQALPLPANVDRSLLRLALLGAINWTRVWYRQGKRTPAQIAHHLVHTVLRKSLG